MMNCRHCNTTVTGNFCCDCGRPVKINRVDWHYIVHEIQHVLHFEKGIFYTVKELLFKPGTSIRDFITADRSRLVKPVLFLVLTSLIYTTIEHLFHIERGYISYSGPQNSAFGLISDWIQRHYGYANIIMGVFIAFWLKLIFRGHGYNFFEMLILLCFVMGVGMLMLSVFAIFEGITGLQSMLISGVVVVVYCSWAIGDFFDRKRITSYFKALTSYMLGAMGFSIAVIILDVLVYLIRR
jgi:hypothetical protein